ncbi:hypothetical protein FNV43_RR24407 [Rhamnella rubrinervis]|uniref:Sororin C-terminal region domain-containing protein n=1 Tax=Rhamnella rubrinervis TaxID=2594499 RepID=A0A8K0DT02_9ROSA|nr:hypothetical protein FNV43_RR24407 [Rhamnella rubrinervis]
METRQARLGVRKPLSDCTNTNHTALDSSSQSSSSSSLLKRRNPNLSSAFKRLLSDTNTKSSSATTTGSSTGNDAVPNPTSSPLPLAASTPPRTLRSPSASGTDVCKVSEPGSVYSRRPAEKRKTKGKAIAEPLSCILASKTHKFGEKIKEDGASKVSKASSVPHKKKQRHGPSRIDNAKHVLPKDFVEQQRAYFAEIDAFELSEEEVDSVAELD